MTLCKQNKRYRVISFHFQTQSERTRKEDTGGDEEVPPGAGKVTAVAQVGTLQNEK